MKLLTKKIGILGYGKEGQSLVRFLESRRVRDMKVFDDHLEEYPDFSEIIDRDVLFRSPGVNPNHPALQNFKGKIIGIAELFLQLCPTKKVIGFTGSNGKSTSATLLTRILEEANDTVFYVGNEGKIFFDALPEIRTRDVVVLELSSFHLWESEQSPQIAILLRMNPDHLDVHGNEDDYLAAKRKIFENQKSSGRVVYNADCPIASQMVKNLPKESVFPFSLKKELDLGLFFRGDELVWKGDNEEDVLLKKGDLSVEKPFQLENVLAAVAAAKMINVRTIPLQTALEKFTGITYRAQLFASTRSGTRVWNDAASTNSIATTTAVREIEPDVLVCGGYSKHIEYSDLSRFIENSSITTIIGYGKVGEEILKEITKKRGVYVSSFADIFDALKENTEKGAKILFSPAGGVLKQFKNVNERGEHFVKGMNQILGEL